VGALTNLVGRKILIIGDSLSDGTWAKPGTFGVPPEPPRTPGQFLAKRLEALGTAPVRIQAKGGRAATYFLKHEGGRAVLEQEIRAHRPDIAVMILGTNDLGWSEATNRAAFQTIRDLFREHGIRIFHIGPPAFVDRLRVCVKRENKRCVKRGQTFNAAAAARVVKPGQELFGSDFLDARPMTKDIVEPVQGRSSDLVHFKLSGAKLWADRMAAALQTAVAPPAAEKPARRPRRAAAFLGGFGVALGVVAVTGGVLWVIERRRALS
jgi:lysophospholipase L1-like esterase